MQKFYLDVSFDWNLTLTDRMKELMRLFGLRLERLKKQRLWHQCSLTLKPGQICYIAGSSGSGKSVLLNALYDQIPADQRIRLSDIPCDSQRSLIDCMDGDVLDAVRTLCKAALGDVFTMLGKPAQLSAGQQWRYRLARVLATDKQWIFVDEFTATLDRISACVIALNLRKIANETGRIFVLASCHEDILMELQPDVVLMKYLNGKTTRIEKHGQTRIFPCPV